jgi:hypothetical protein
MTRLSILTEVSLHNFKMAIIALADLNKESFQSFRIGKWHGKIFTQQKEA